MKLPSGLIMLILENSWKRSTTWKCKTVPERKQLCMFHPELRTKGRLLGRSKYQRNERGNFCSMDQSSYVKLGGVFRPSVVTCLLFTILFRGLVGHFKRAPGKKVKYCTSKECGWLCRNVWSSLELLYCSSASSVLLQCCCSIVVLLFQRSGTTFVVLAYCCNFAVVLLSSCCASALAVVLLHCLCTVALVLLYCCNAAAVLLCYCCSTG